MYSVIEALNKSRSLSLSLSYIYRSYLRKFLHDYIAKL